ncbi:MAG: hypothetical protein H6842_13920 [Rhodospirillaceae bacterium]|nr:hypothetical protein [Rhodospirillaceae bacterium]
MAKRNDHSRVLIYSHDSFGLGHLRRCRAIAHALVQRDPQMSVLILSGSPIIGSYEFGARVDFVRIPGVIKLSNGEYTSLSLKIDLAETLAMRASIIEHTASIFDPDLFLVDKEPLGLRGEVKGTLELLKARGTPLVLGLRDVLDEPGQLAPEWERKNVLPALRHLYDSIWVYGLPQICDPLEGIAVPQSVRRKVAYTGYLRRARSGGRLSWASPFGRPFILVTPGGGGDGDELVDWVLRAYEQAGTLPHPALIVLGPFMQLERQSEFMVRAAALDDVEMITFEAHMEDLMEQAVGIVGMGGYNTFCEILSFDKRAIVVPRERPRREQFMRAERADRFGLVRMLPADEVMDTQQMIDALVRLPAQPKPSEVMIPGLLDGLDRVHALVGEAIADARGLPATFRERQTA